MHRIVKIDQENWCIIQNFNSKKHKNFVINSQLTARIQVISNTKSARIQPLASWYAEKILSKITSLLSAEIFSAKGPWISFSSSWADKIIQIETLLHKAKQSSTILKRKFAASKNMLNHTNKYNYKKKNGSMVQFLF